MRVECIMHVGNGGGCFYRGVRACVCARARASSPGDDCCSVILLSLAQPAYIPRGRQCHNVTLIHSDV